MKINLSENCNLDIQKLIATRMLINANSGGGKSWAIRRFLEQSNGKVQQIVLDLEGEFNTLREKYDYLLVGPGGEIPANIRTAELLARKLLELNVSTIIDLSELKQHERITFVKRFVDSLIHSPKNLWHPALIVIDEAHHFCPQTSKCESMSSIIDLCTRGRKRGFSAVLATQRISKLHKDAAAECNNQMMGRAVQDIDQKRVGDILGFTSKEDIRSLKDLKAGEFYFQGPAFEHNDTQKFKIGNVQTTHPDRTRGIEAMESYPTPENIKKLMKDVIDLPKEAEEELRTTKDFKRKIQELKTKLTISERDKPKIDPEALEKAKNQGISYGYERCKKEMSKEIDFLRKENTLLIKRDEKIADILKLGLPPRPDYIPIEDKFKIVAAKQTTPILTKPELIEKLPSEISKLQYTSDDAIVPGLIPAQAMSEIIEEIKVKAGALRMLSWVAAVNHPISKQRLATLSGFPENGGTFKTYISVLKKKGWIEGTEAFMATAQGMENAKAIEFPTGEQLVELWASKFKAGVGKMLRYLYSQYPNEVSKEELGSVTGFEPTEGTFKTYLSNLKKSNLVEVNGNIKISEEFFE